MVGWVFWVMIALMVTILWHVYQQLVLGNYDAVEKKLKNRVHHNTPTILMLCLLLPICIYLSWAPSSCHARTALAIVLLWTAPSKLILLIFFSTEFDSAPWITSSFSHFLVALLLPIRILGTRNAHNKNFSSISLPSAAHNSIKALVLLGVMNIYPHFHAIPEALLYLLYCIHFYLGIMLPMDSLAAIVASIYGVEVAEQFNIPIMAETLEEFWGKRWNRTVHSLLKEAVYKPVLALNGKRGSTSVKKKWVAMVSTFGVSAVMHEIIFVVVSRSPPTGEMSVFFLLHGLVTSIRKPNLGHIELPKWMKHVTTCCILYITVSIFFLRPLRRSGTDRQAIAEYHHFQSSILYLSHKLISWISSWI